MINDAKAIKAYNHYYDHPVDFAADILQIPKIEKEQVAILNAIANDSQVAIKSGHGIGKTAVLSWAMIWFLMTRPFCRIPCTAPTQHQLHDILWTEASKWISRAKLNTHIEWTATKISMRIHSDTWFAVARSAAKPENLQGFHEDHILFIVEEASGVDQKIMEVVEGALTNEGAKLLMVGNPTKISGTFFNAFNKDRAIYKTYTFSSENSKRVSKDYIKKMARYGKDSDVYRVRVKGEFPAGEPDTLISLHDIEPAINRKITEKWDKYSIGVDPARYGDDESVIVWRRGLQIFIPDPFLGINTVRLTGEVIKLAREIYKTYKGVVTIKIDDTGIGGGVTDQVEAEMQKQYELPEEKREINIEVIPVINNGEATDPDFADYGTEMWVNMKDALKTVSLPDDDDLVAQLSTRKYEVLPNGKIKLEQKKQMKKRDLPSPDRADALALCLAEDESFDMSDLKVSVKKR